ncbi:MAG: hypothetical protein WCS92_03160 [Candidatus Babeliales bacterium]|jgi:hypothetical protein
MFLSKSFSLFFLLTVVGVSYIFPIKYLPIISSESQYFVPNAVFCKLHTQGTCASGYFYDLSKFFLYHFGDLSEQDPSKKSWSISEIRQRYSKCSDICRCEICPSEDCYEEDSELLHQPGKVFITYHDKIWQYLAIEEITSTNLPSNLGDKNLIDHINMRLDPSAKPEACHAEIDFYHGRRMIYFFSTSPLQCILSMPYDGPAKFTHKEMEYFSKFLDITQFRNPAYRIIGAFDNLAPCLLQ